MKWWRLPTLKAKFAIEPPTIVILLKATAKFVLKPVQTRSSMGRQFCTQESTLMLVQYHATRLTRSFTQRKRVTSTRKPAQDLYIQK